MTNTRATCSNGKRLKRSWPPRGMPKRGSRRPEVAPVNPDRQAKTIVIRRCGPVRRRYGR
ncbi:hypothetical protein GCM10009634_48520 [Saccharothrix xinjiangensis]